MTRSADLSGGNYFFAFLPDRIAVSLITDEKLWDRYRETSYNWITIVSMIKRKFYLEGTNLDNIKVVGVDE